MSLILQLLFICISANLDNLAIGITYGLRKIVVPFSSNLIMALIAFLFSFSSVLFGRGIACFLSERIAGMLGAFLLIGAGLWLTFEQSGRNKKTEKTKPLIIAILNQPEQADRDNSTVINLYESIILGMAVSINCLTNGVTAGLWGLGALPISIINAGLSLLTIWSGSWIGRRFGADWLGKRANVIAGCLLLLLGLQQFLFTGLPVFHPH